jgi:hypothetical protein
MKRITAMAVALLVPALLTGCEENDDLLGNDDELVGDFRATDFGFAGDANPNLVRDFDREGSTFSLRLRNDGTFESTFTERGFDPLVRTGRFTTAGDQLVLGNQGLFNDVQDGEQRFVFQRMGTNGLRLRSAAATRFDFNRDDNFEAEESSFFEGDFEAF